MACFARHLGYSVAVCLNEVLVRELDCDGPKTSRPGAAGTGQDLKPLRLRGEDAGFRLAPQDQDVDLGRGPES